MTRIWKKAPGDKTILRAERLIDLTAATKRAINSSMLPADAGCIVDNVETLIGIHMAVAEGKPLTERVVTVSGDAINSSETLKFFLEQTIWN